MRQKTGKLHVFISPRRREKVHIVGDEEGLYRLWMAVEAAMISRKGMGAAPRLSGAWNNYRLIVLRVDSRSCFFRRFAR